MQRCLKHVYDVQTSLSDLFHMLKNEVDYLCELTCRHAHIIITRNPRTAKHTFFINQVNLIVQHTKHIIFDHPPASPNSWDFRAHFATNTHPRYTQMILSIENIT